MTSPLNSATRIHFAIKANTANTKLIVLSADGAPADFTGSTFSMAIKARNSNDEPTGSVLLTLSTGSGISGTLGDGEVEITFPSEDNGGLPAGAYIYDLLRLESAAPVECVAVGKIDVEEGIG